MTEFIYARVLDSLHRLRPCSFCSVDSPDSFSTFALNGQDLDVNTTRSPGIVTQDNALFHDFRLRPEDELLRPRHRTVVRLQDRRAKFLRLAQKDEDNSALHFNVYVHVLVPGSPFGDGRFVAADPPDDGDARTHAATCVMAGDRPGLSRLCSSP